MAIEYNVVIEEGPTVSVINEITYSVVVEELPNNVVIEEIHNTVVVEEPRTIIVEIPQGPQGLPGISEADMTYARRVDFINDNLLYKGEATVGTLDSEPLWRIHRLVIASDDDVTETWADGTDGFVHAWTDRLVKAYS
jgi:hypothetical protein